MKHRGLVILWWAVCIAVVAIVWVDAFGPSLNPLWSWLQANDKAASWIQAFGSIAAIVGSTFVAIFVSHRDAQQRRQEAIVAEEAAETAALRVLLTAVLVLKSSLAMCHSNTVKQSWNANTARLAERNLQGAIKLLGDVDGGRIPQWFEAQRGVMLVSAISATSGTGSIDAWKIIPPTFTAFKKSLNHVIEVEKRLNLRLYGF